MIITGTLQSDLMTSMTLAKAVHYTQHKTQAFLFQEKRRHSFWGINLTVSVKINAIKPFK